MENKRIFDESEFWALIAEWNENYDINKDYKNKVLDFAESVSKSYAIEKLEEVRPDCRSPHSDDVCSCCKSVENIIDIAIEKIREGRKQNNEKNNTDSRAGRCALRLCRPFRKPKAPRIRHARHQRVL